MRKWLFLLLLAGNARAAITIGASQPPSKAITRNPEKIIILKPPSQAGRLI